MNSNPIIVQHGICVGMRKSLKFLTAQFNNLVEVEEENLKSRRADEMYDDFTHGATDQANGRLELANELQKHLDTAISELMKEQKYLLELKKEYENFHGKEALDVVNERIQDTGLLRSKHYEYENKIHKKTVKSLSEIAMVLTGSRLDDSLKEYRKKENTDEKKSEISVFLKNCRVLKNDKSRTSYDINKELNETQIFTKLSISKQVQIIELGKRFIELFSNKVDDDDDNKMSNFINIVKSNLEKL